jgi:histidinol-phosphate aminotransferase
MKQQQHAPENILPALEVEPSPAVAGLEPYSSAGTAEHVDLWLDANESPLAPGLPAAALEAASATLNRYPSARALEAHLARRHGLDPAAVLVTAGADDALERAIRVAGGPGREVVLPSPGFVMLARYARLAGAPLRQVEWWQGEFPVDQACAGAPAAVLVVSPNNPTGAVISGPALSELADRLPGALIVLDHAYVEFADEDLTELALGWPNVVVTRTLSKAWAAAGLRIGYALGDPRVIHWLRAAGHPYAVSSLSLAAARWLLDQRESFRAQRVGAVRAERARLQGLLADLGAEALPSQANLVLARFADAGWVRSALASLGIAVRAFSGTSELDGWLRLTVPGDDSAFARLEHALAAALRPQAVLFDLDGVLADVSRSYRAAILGTAAGYGVELDPHEITEAKAAGQANNDWELTRRLLAAHGVERTLEEITERFEDLYQGDHDTPGLWRSERLLTDPAVLRRLAERYPLAIVTGRPRSDVERFLAVHGIGDCFETVVAMEDAPLKPDPAPVRLALERLGAERAWMVGDTPDDLVAARAAGVVPVGVVSPSDDSDAARQVLARSGAARVLNNVCELEEVLP